MISFICNVIHIDIWIFAIENDIKQQNEKTGPERKGKHAQKSKRSSKKILRYQMILIIFDSKIYIIHLLYVKIYALSSLLQYFTDKLVYRRRKRIKKKKIEKELEPNLNQFIDYINKQEQSDKSKADKSMRLEKRK